MSTPPEGLGFGGVGGLGGPPAAAFVELKRIYQNGHSWYALADVLDQLNNIWHINVGARFSDEPTDSEAATVFTQWGSGAEEHGAEERNPLNDVARFRIWLFQKFKPIFHALIQGIVQNPGITFNQAVAGLEAQFPNSIYDMRQLLIQIGELLDVPGWDQFKQFVLDHQQYFEEGNWQELELGSGR